jgi:hypothetical protein
VVALDLIGEQIELASYLRGIKRLSVNYGVDYGKNQEQILQLFGDLIKANWTNARWEATVTWVINNSPFPTWNQATFFTAPMDKLYSEGEILTRKRNGEKFTCYKVGNVYLWGESHLTFPFPVVEFHKPKAEPEGKKATPEEIREIMRGVKLEAKTTTRKEAVPLEELLTTKQS